MCWGGSATFVVRLVVRVVVVVAVNAARSASPAIAVRLRACRLTRLAGVKGILGTACAAAANAATSIMSSSSWSSSLMVSTCSLITVNISLSFAVASCNFRNFAFNTVQQCIIRCCCGRAVCVNGLNKEPPSPRGLCDAMDSI